MKPNVEATMRVQRRRQIKIHHHKAERGCRDCGEKDFVVLELHHRDPQNKNPKLRKAGNLCQLKEADLDIEFTKCDVLCANCHKREEARLRGFYKYHEAA